MHHICNAAPQNISPANPNCMYSVGYEYKENIKGKQIK